VAAAARLGSRVKQARSGRQPTTASLTLSCWNVRSLSPQIKATLSLEISFDQTGTGHPQHPVSFPRLNLEEFIWINKEYHAICWRGFEIAEKPKQGVGIAVRNTLRPCVEQPLIATFRLRRDANTQRKEHQICTCNRQATIEITSSTTFTLLLPVRHHILQVLPECGLWDREAINGHSADS